MSVAEVEFPVGGLLNGDSYKTSTRTKNISAAMTWIQKQLESLRDSDKQLLSLFHKLETDMAELKLVYADGQRGRNSSVSSIRDVYTKSSSSGGLILQETLQLPTGTNGGKVKILEEETPAAVLEHSDSNDSLADFADELGFDEDEDEEEEGESSPPIFKDRPSIRSQSSGVSSTNDINFSMMLPVSTHSLPEEKEEIEESSLDESVRGYTLVTSHTGSPRDERGRGGRRLSNDSGAVADNDSTGSSAAGESSNSKEQGGVGANVGLSLSAEEEEKKRLSGFADEIFAMFKL